MFFKLLLTGKPGIKCGTALMALAFTAANILLTAIPSNAQNLPETGEKARVMIIGTTHFGNPGQDVINTKFPDVLKPKYQRQIEDVIDSLAEFAPTKIGLEARPDYKAEFDSMYQAYMAGTHQLTRNERQQLGFRLAKRFDHPQVYSIDHDGEFPFEEVLQHAKKHDSGFMKFFKETREYIETKHTSVNNTRTIRGILRYHNGSENLAMQRDFYARTAAVGNDTTWPGVDLVSKWHRRNIKIFGHLARITEPGDRVVVIFGSGHAPLLRYFVKSSRSMELVDPLDYL